MQPLKLIIEGAYWDSYIYRGKLYLFGMDGSIRTVDWNGLIDQLNSDKSLHLAITSAFLNSNYLYGELMKPVFEDIEIRDIIVRKFQNASEQRFAMSDEWLEKFTISRQDNKFPFPHSDATCYYNAIYVGSGKGVHSAGCGGGTVNGISTRVSRTTDIPVRSLTASYYNLAVAAGDDGLFQVPLTTNDLEGKVLEERCLSEINCDGCDWTFHSIYGSSHIDKSVMARFNKQYYDDVNRQKKFRREFDKLIFDDEIFDNSGYSWGTRDKLYQAATGLVRIVKYNPSRTRDSAGEFESLGQIELEPWKGVVISGGTGLFGTVIECENAIVVIMSNEEIFTIPGEPVNWRVFPRSLNYENQLHVVFDSRLEVYSFNQDYLVDQKSKKAGTEFSPLKRRYGQ